MGEDSAVEERTSQARDGGGQVKIRGQFAPLDARLQGSALQPFTEVARPDHPAALLGRAVP